jgi:hypothetical protein
LYYIVWSGVNGKIEVLEERPVPVPLYPPDIPETVLRLSLAF